MRAKNFVLNEHYKNLVEPIIFLNIISLGFLAIKIIASNSWFFGFLAWNLTLAWLPVMFAVWLTKSLKTLRWQSPKNISLTVLWLLFLPNSFYLASDLVHLNSSSSQNVLFDMVMLFSFAINGFLAGIIGLYLVHHQLYKRFWANQAHALIAFVITASSFAIYLGRNLRWNTWDVFLHPVGLLFDVSDRLLDPLAHPQAFSVTAIFCILIGSIYAVVWKIYRIMFYNEAYEDRD